MSRRLQTCPWMYVRRIALTRNVVTTVVAVSAVPAPGPHLSALMGFVKLNASRTARGSSVAMMVAGATAAHALRLLPFAKLAYASSNVNLTAKVRSVAQMVARAAAVSASRESIVTTALARNSA
jgi:hypothetical protein